jgi:hypothetical protein
MSEGVYGYFGLNSMGNDATKKMEKNEAIIREELCMISHQ